MLAVIIMGMPAVVDHTDQVRPIQWVGLLPLTPRSPAGHQLGVCLATQLDVLPQVVTLPVEVGPVLQVLGGARVLPGDPGAVAGVSAGYGGGALRPGARIVIVSTGITLDQGAVISVGFISCVLLHIVVSLAGVGDVLGDVDKVVGPREVIISSICVWIINWIVTVGDDALQVRGVDREVTRPVTAGVVRYTRFFSGASPSDQESSIFTFPPDIIRVTDVSTDHRSQDNLICCQIGRIGTLHV